MPAERLPDLPDVDLSMLIKVDLPDRIVFTTVEATSLPAHRRTKGAEADPRCECGNYPAACSQMGRPCCFRDATTSEQADRD